MLFKFCSKYEMLILWPPTNWRKCIGICAEEVIGSGPCRTSLIAVLKCSKPLQIKSLVEVFQLNNVNSEQLLAKEPRRKFESVLIEKRIEAIKCARDDPSYYIIGEKRLYSQLFIYLISIPILGRWKRRRRGLRKNVSAKYFTPDDITKTVGTGEKGIAPPETQIEYTKCWRKPWAVVWPRTELGCE